MRPRLSNAVPLALVTLAAVACARSEKSVASSADSAASTTAAQPAPSPAPNVVTIIARDYSFQAPDTIPAGLTTLRLVSQGKQPHQAALVRLDDGKSMKDLAAVLSKPGPMPAWVHDAGGPNPPEPGGGIAQVTEEIAPGSYVIACFVPGPDGKPHFTKGMMRPLYVAPPAPGAPVAAEPVATDTIKLVDYTFEMSRPLTTGHHVFRVESDGTQSHEVFIVRLAPGKKAADMAAWVDKMSGPPPADPMGGVFALPPGSHAYFSADLTPGDYALFCFVPDAKDGKPHVAHGMMKQFTVGT